MKKLLILCIILTPMTTIAKPKLDLHAGMSLTTLRQEGGKSQWGNVFGGGIEFTLPWNTCIGFDGMFITRKAKLENKTWPTTRSIKRADVSIGDIFMVRKSFEFLPQIGYKMRFYNEKIRFCILFGYGFEILIDDASYVISDEIILEPSEKGNYNFDYILKDGIIPFFSKNICTGFNLHYGMFGIELCYHWDKTFVPVHNELSANDNLDSLVLLFRIMF